MRRSEANAGSMCSTVYCSAMASMSWDGIPYLYHFAACDGKINLIGSGTVRPKWKL